MIMANRIRQREFCPLPSILNTTPARTTGTRATGMEMVQARHTHKRRIPKGTAIKRAAQRARNRQVLRPPSCSPRMCPTI